jgi:hypothetical protein
MRALEQGIIETNGEIFEEINGFCGYYVSNRGVVISKRFNRPMKQYRNEDGYMMCALSKNGKSKTVRVHRLVADTFIPNPCNLPQVNHKDGNKTNNSSDNLEWVNNSGNIMHRYYNLGLGTMRKVRCVETGIVYHSQKEAERMTGINGANISSCCTHRPKYKTAGGFHWEFADNIDKPCKRNDGGRELR